MGGWVGGWVCVCVYRCYSTQYNIHAHTHVHTHTHAHILTHTHKHTLTFMHTQLRISEMEVSKARNLIEHEREIFSRPARTWIPTNTQNNVLLY